MASVNITVDNLTCEYLRNPLGIDVPNPRLSWMLRSSVNGEVQTAYQVLVSSSEELLKADNGDLWDSGKIASDQSIFIAYTGKKLTSGAKCFWKVRVWDKNGNPSSWSENAFWSMGLLDPEEWQAKWIAHRAALDPEETLSKDIKTRTPETEAILTQKVGSPIFRREFDASKPIKSAVAYICAPGFYEMHINGVKIGDTVLNPNFTRFDKRCEYVTADVTEFIKQGDNAIGIMLGNGWYNSHVRDAWIFDYTPWRNTPRFLFHMDIEYADGSTKTVVSDGSWKTTTGPIVYDAIRIGEYYDARLEKPGWDLTGYSDKDWKAALEVEDPGGMLVARKTVPARVVETIRPTKVTSPKPGVYVLDVGRNISGWGRIKVSGPAGTVITIRYSELLKEDGLVNQSNISAIVYSGKFQTDTYVLKGEGVEVWEPHFVYHGFQYAQVEGFPGVPTVDNFLACVVHADFEDMGSFECSNDLLNKIQRNTRWSYLGNFVSFPTDCPHREKNGWTGDSHIAAETGIYNFNPQANYAKWMFDFDDCQRETGDLPGIVPTGDWGYEWGNGPAWDSAYFLIPYYVYLYTGDDKILKDHYEGYKLYIDSLTSHSEDYIADLGLGDWCPPEGGSQGFKTPRSLTSTAYYYVDTLITVKVAGMLGKQDDEKKYTELAKEIGKAFNDKFYDAATGMYKGEEQTAMATALYQGLVPDGEKDKVLKALLSEIDKHDGHLWCGILGTKYILHALTDNGKADVAYTIATQRTFPSWGDWIDRGATTLWESWKGDYSQNHIMFGDISAWFYSTLGGIKPDSDYPGFKHTIIQPHVLGDLKWVRAEHISMYGRIRSYWSKGENGLTLEVEVPVNSTATVYVPAEDAEKIDTSNAVGSKYMRMENGYAVYEAGSGVYRFQVG